MLVLTTEGVHLYKKIVARERANLREYFWMFIKLKRGIIGNIFIGRTEPISAAKVTAYSWFHREGKYTMMHATGVLFFKTTDLSLR